MKKSHFMRLSFLVAVFIIACAGILSAQEATKDAEPTKPYSTKQSFADISVGILPVYDIFNKSFGFETRLDVETNRLSVPLQWLLVRGNLRIRTWPEIFFTNRNTPKDPSAFVSIFTESEVKKRTTDYSYSELGLGGGFSGGGFNLGVWLTTNLYQGTPKVKDLFGFRARATFRPIDPLHFMFAMRIGTSILKSDLGITTSGTTLNLELEVGYKVWQELAILLSAEARTDNMAALLDKQAKVSGITDALQVLIKFGVGYKF